MSDGTEARATIYIEGLGEIYEDTGELVTPDQETPLRVQNAFLNPNEPTVFGMDDAEWAMRRMFELDAKLKESETALKARVEAITENYSPVINRLVRARERFEKWVSPYLKEFATRELERRNRKADGTPRANPEKSIRTMHGSLTFRFNSGADEKVACAPDTKKAVALEYVRQHVPHAVKMEPEIDYSAFTEADREQIRAATDIPLVVVDALPGGDRFGVKTGVR
jgi:hypothetical protein